MKLNLVNRKFWSFQKNSSRLQGFSVNQSLPTNEFFFYSHENFYLSSKHIDIITWYLKRKLKKSGTYQFIYACDYPITRKPTEIWMGKGKGEIHDWCMPIKQGTIFFKIKLKNPVLITAITSFIKSKLPITISLSYSKHIINQLNFLSFNLNTKTLPIYEAKLIKKWFIQELN